MYVHRVRGTLLSQTPPALSRAGVGSLMYRHPHLHIRPSLARALAIIGVVSLASRLYDLRRTEEVWLVHH